MDRHATETQRHGGFIYSVSLCLCGIFTLLEPNAEIVDQIAAVIGNGEPEVITFSDLQILVRYRGLDVPQDPQERREFYREKLEELINQKIIAREAEQTPGVHVEPEEVERQIEAFKQRFPSEDAFQKKLQESQMTVEDLYELFRRQLMVSEFIQVRFEPFVIVLPDQIQAYYGTELVPELRRQGQPIPRLELVEESIRQILIERETSRELERWVTSARRKADVQILLFRQPPMSPNVPKNFLKEQKN